MATTDIDLALFKSQAHSIEKSIILDAKIMETERANNEAEKYSQRTKWQN